MPETIAMSKLTKKTTAVVVPKPVLTLKKKPKIAAIGSTVIKPVKDKLKVVLPLHTQTIPTSTGGQVKLHIGRNIGPYAWIEPKPGANHEDQGNWNCTIQPWTGTVHSPETVILNPNFTRLYPGAVFDYKNIANGTYTTVPFARKPLTLVADGMHFSLPTVTIQNPDMGSVNTALSQIKQTQWGIGSRSVGARFAVLSEEHQMISTGAKAQFFGMGAAAKFDWTSKNKTHKYLIEVYQTYFSVSVNDSINDPSDFFYTKAERPNNSDAATSINENWVYVDRVDYGRYLQVMFESERSFESVGIDVSADLDWLVVSGSAEFSYDQMEVLKNTSVKVVAIGGNPIFAGQLVNSSSLGELKGKVDNYFSGSNDEVPIAYSLRTLDGAIVGAKMSAEFTSRHCAPKASKYAVTWDKIHCRVSDDSSGGEEVRAMVRIRGFKGNGKDVLDLDKYNQGIIMLSGGGGITPWTFAKGSDDNPIHMKGANESSGPGDVYKFNKTITFPFDPNDANAKIGIRADVIEYDTDGDDQFTDDLYEIKISQITDAEEVVLTCNHDDSRIDFYFRVFPVYE